METFKTKQSNKTSLYLKIVVKTNSISYSKTWIVLQPGDNPIDQTSSGNGSYPEKDTIPSWYKLGKTKDFLGKELVIDTLIGLSKNYAIDYYLVEDDDNISPIINSEKYDIKSIIQIESGTNSDTIRKKIKIS